MPGKIICSRVSFDGYDELSRDSFYGCIKDLLEAKDIGELAAFTQHMGVTRLQHSLNVSYYSFLFCRFFGLDYKSGARAGLLHDLFLYDWRKEKQPEGAHVFAHPIVALRNAAQISEINEIERDAILSHMWPIAKTLPKFAESYLVSAADKFCSVAEIIMNYGLRIKYRYCHGR